jgi:chromosome segregation ATPase
VVSNEERISRLEGIAEATAGQLGDIRAEINGLRGEMSDLRAEIRAMRQELYAEIRSNRNTLLMVTLLMWMTTIGTLLGLFFGVR